MNGAGLAMSTMDIIKLYGGEPANFLDVGGSAGGEALVEAMKLVHDDEEVKAIFVNIFGGILQTDILAGSIIEASKTCNFTKPIVCRLKGTNSDIAKKMIGDVSEDATSVFTAYLCAFSAASPSWSRGHTIRSIHSLFRRRRATLSLPRQQPAPIDF